MTQNILNKMKNADIRIVNKDTLVDVSGFDFDNTLSQEERAKRVCKTIKNPYLFRFGDMAVKLEFAENGPSMQDLVSGFLVRQKSGL